MDDSCVAWSANLRELSSGLVGTACLHSANLLVVHVDAHEEFYGRSLHCAGFFCVCEITHSILTSLLLVTRASSIFH